MKLSAQLKYLLHLHECVIIPDFGGFLSHEVPSEYNELTSIAQPKSKRISFNSKLQNHDGLLANQLSQDLGISYKEALEYISEDISAFKEDLKEKKNVELEGIGTFYLNKEDALLFIPSVQSNFEISSFGLPKLKLKQQEKPAPKPTPEPIIPLSTNKDSSRTEIRKERNLQTQTQKTKQEHKTSKFSKLSVINVLGSIFLLAMVFAVLNFELSQSHLDFEPQSASILDTPNQSESPLEVNLETEQADAQEIISRFERKNQRPQHQILLDGTFSLEGVEKIQADLLENYPQSKIIELENGFYTVSIMSFTNEDLAKEYVKLVKKALNHTLTIR